MLRLESLRQCWSYRAKLDDNLKTGSRRWGSLLTRQHASGVLRYCYIVCVHLIMYEAPDVTCVSV